MTIEIKIPGQDTAVSLDTIKADLGAAKEKGFSQFDWCFTWATVEGLIDAIDNLQPKESKVGFKVGDKVKRISGCSTLMPSDFVGIVTETFDYGFEQVSLKFAEFDSLYFGDNFEIVKE